MKKILLWIFLVLLFLALGLGAAFVYFVVLPYRAAASSMPENVTLTIRQDAQNELTLTWPEAAVADYYSVELQLPLTPEAIAAEEEPIVFHQEYVHGTSCVLPRIPTDLEFVIKISTVVEFQTAWETQLRLCDNPVVVTATINQPTLSDLTWTPDPDTDTVTVTFQPIDATHTRVYLAQEDGTLTLWRTLTEGQTQFTFGEGKDLPIPDHDGKYTFVFDNYRISEGLEYYGIPCGELSVVREDLLDRELDFTLTEEGHNVYSMTWEETKGEYYELQQYDAELKNWVTLAQVAKDGERTYTTGHLPNLRDFQFRVLAVGGQTNPGSPYAAESETIAVTTVASPIYCTVWPVLDLEAYTTSTGAEVAGKVKTGKAYCVLDEKDGKFGVMLDGQIRYIDSNYCMINLAEIFGDLCSYDITNSYSSLYMVHEYEIPKVTAKVTAGYKHVKMADGKFLVPLLYPTSQKILAAAQEAVKRGYRLKIYDSYRPNQATVEIYDLTKKILEDPIPSKTFTGKKLTDLPKVEEGKKLTYQRLMTNDTWSLGSFLAQGASLHNLGIAVDLTLEDLEGNELKMQSSIHDLSWYSTPNRNNANAKLLAEIMTGADLVGISSEWWHFQDNEIRASLSLPVVWGGVTPECWMADDEGWRYRRQNGTFFADCTQQIDGVTYIFDAAGYAKKAE